MISLTRNEKVSGGTYQRRHKKSPVKMDTHLNGVCSSSHAQFALPMPMDCPLQNTMTKNYLANQVRTKNC